MTRSFKDPYKRVPNFGIEGAIPKPPWWANIDDWRIVPPRSPPWSPPPSGPVDGPNPFDDPARTPAPLQPAPESLQVPSDADLIDWLFRTYRNSRQGRATQLPRPRQGGDAPDPFLDARPWHVIEPPLDLPQPAPFYAGQLDNLLRLSPKETREYDWKPACRREGGPAADLLSVRLTHVNDLPIPFTRNELILKEISSMGGQSTSTQTTQSQTTPWTAAQPALQTMLSQISAGLNNTGLTSTERLRARHAEE